LFSQPNDYIQITYISLIWFYAQNEHLFNHLPMACPPTYSRTAYDTSVWQAPIPALVIFAIQSILTHNYPLHGATCIRWPSWINYLFNRCCSFLLLSNSLQKFWFLKMDYPNLWWPQWWKVYCMFWMVYLIVLKLHQMMTFEITTMLVNFVTKLPMTAGVFVLILGCQWWWKWQLEPTDEFLTVLSIGVI